MGKLMANNNNNLIVIESKTMKFIYGVLLVFSCSFALTFSSDDGRLPSKVPVYHPPYDPIDMEQFRPRVKGSEVARRIQLTFQEALKMVRRQKLQSCVALIICTLACDPHAYGPDGDETYSKLIHFNHLSNSTQIPETNSKDIAMFKDAELKGIAHAKHCDLCKSDYPRCRREVVDLLQMFLNFEIED
uniref:Uncharacterized protein n=1 Tax=Tetranychus urticae TaxID=32264 RepID=T1K7U9_TETUR